MGDKVYSVRQVQKLVYQAFKQGQGGSSTDQYGGRLGLQNRRMTALRKLFPKVYPPHPATRAALRRREQPKFVYPPERSQTAHLVV